MKEEQNVSFVKLTKEEQQVRLEEKKKTKAESYEKIPEKDRIKQKKYRRLIIETSALFVAALAVLALLAVGMVPAPAGIGCLVVIALLSTYISRRDR